MVAATSPVPPCFPMKGIKMRKFTSTAIGLGLLLSAAVVPAVAQPGPPGDRPGAHERDGMKDGWKKDGWKKDEGKKDGWKKGGGRDGDAGPRHGSGDRPDAMLKLIILLADTDGNGSLSLEEVQAVHARIFKSVDKSGDGQATEDEIRAFFRSMHGGPERGSDDDERPDDGAPSRP